MRRAPTGSVGLDQISVRIAPGPHLVSHGRRHEVRIALDELHARPIAFKSKQQEIPVHGVMPACPGMPERVRADVFPVETGLRPGGGPCLLDLAAALFGLLFADLVRLAGAGAEHAARAPGQAGQRVGRPRAEIKDTIAAVLRVAQHGPQVRQIDVAPVQGQGFA